MKIVTEAWAGPSTTETGAWDVTLAVTPPAGVVEFMTIWLMVVVAGMVVVTGVAADAGGLAPPLLPTIAPIPPAAGVTVTATYEDENRKGAEVPRSVATTSRA